MTQTKDFYLLNNDVIFKNVFNTKERLKRLLESILKVEIYDIREKNTELEKTNKKNKKLVLDLVLDTNVGKINVEVNNNSKNYIIKRNLLYFFRLIGMCLKEAEDYKDIDMHTQINLTWNLQRYYDYDIRNRDKIELYITDVKTHKIRYGNVFKIIDVNMDYFNRLCYTEDMKEEERLLKFLSSKNEKELEANSEGDRFMEEIKDKVYLLNEDPEIIEQLYVEGEERRVRNTERKLGREEGLEQGLEQGYKEKSIEIAKNMLKDNMDIDIITKYTGLTPDEIEYLK